MIRETFKNLIYMAINYNTCKITSRDFIIRPKNNDFPDFISINPYFNILNALFASETISSAKL